jgi:ABC-type multidrug transport system fused ATPase/permease subunit
VSHRPERKEKDCLNCGVEVQGRFCHFCGQQNVEPKETFWELVTHFIYDLTHFDGNFFSTLKYLLFKPGFLSLEYIKGRRMRYLNPIRMYIFISAFFFLFFFSVVNPVGDDFIKINDSNLTSEKVKEKIEKKQNKLQKYLADSTISSSHENIIKDQLVLLNNDLERLMKDTNNLKELNYFKLDAVDVSPKKYTTIKQYDSVQTTLPTSKRDGWFKRKIEIRKLELIDKHGRDMRLIFNKLLDKFLHSFPQILFVSLPLFALLLQLLYIRRKDRYYYVDHVIYSVHLYCAMFIFIFIMMCLDKLEDVHYLSWLSFIGIPVFIYILWYIYKSMRKFYQQSRIKTVLKYLLLMFISFFVMSFLFMFFFIFSAFTL